MLMTRPGRGALVGLCLLSLPLLSFAQTGNDTTTNAATASLQRMLTRAVAAEFSPLSSVKVISSTDQVLVAQAQENPPNQNKPTDAGPAVPTLGGLGFPTDQTLGNAQAQARLDRRSHMLKLHQRMGLLTLAPLIATIATSGMAGGRNPTAAGRDIHGGLGAVTADMYFMTAYYALRAPRVRELQSGGPSACTKL